jgi:hypothetical protein
MSHSSPSALGHNLNHEGHEGITCYPMSVESFLVHAVNVGYGAHTRKPAIYKSL